MVYSNANPVQMWLAAEQTFNQKEVGGITPACFSQIFNESDTITLQYSDGSGYSLGVFNKTGSLIDSASFSAVETGVYQASYTPTGLNGEFIQLKIMNGGTPVMQSDSILIHTNHSPSVLIAYSNYNNYAGLVYDVSPVTFYFRCQAVFFHEEPAVEQEDLELSDDTIQTLYSKMQMKRLFEIGYVPYYIHQKLSLIFNHQFITIDGKDWIKRDAYEIDKGSKRYPLKKGQVLLTDQDYIKRNLL